MVAFKTLNVLRNVKESNKIPPQVPDEVWQNPFYFIAFGFGTGAIPFAPGTFGTLLAIPFYLMLATLSLSWYLLTVILLVIFSSWLSETISKRIQIHDHPGMNIDEFIGFFVTMIAVPPTWGAIILGFLFFRLFDILKPWPINVADQTIQGGFGMILDDVLAGIYSCILLQIVLYFWQLL